MPLQPALLLLLLSPDDKPQPIVTDRPDFTESAETVPAGRVQLEGGYTFARVGPAREHSIGEILFRIAAGARWEARLGFNSYLRSDTPGSRASGFEDSSLGLKVKLMDGDERPGLRRPNLAIVLATSIPTGSAAYRESNWQPEAKFCATWDLSEALALSSNLNYTWISESGMRFGQIGGSLSLGCSVTDRVGSYLEWFGFTPAGKGGPNANYLNGGLTYLVNDDFQLDLRAGIGLNSASPNHFVGVGAARRW